ncbi:hypothetical protein [Neptunomonas sp.]|uniref:hypothetical protein n=1 Tax=Neptunomonas sp. TaxID=1971898 RepID=UPI0025FD3B6C|nr:hypothetical protein [Neptunomonas sp.]
MNIRIFSQKAPLAFKVLMAVGVSCSIAAASNAAAAGNKRAVPVFPIQSFSTGSADDVWVIRTNSTLEYCRSGARGNKKSQGKAAIHCYQQDRPTAYRFASVQAVHNTGSGVVSAYALTANGDLVYCRAKGANKKSDKKKSEKLKISCHL